MSHPGFEITIVYGDKDIYGISKEWVIGRYPTSNIRTIDNCGHFPWLQNRPVFDEILQDHFLPMVSE